MIRRPVIHRLAPALAVLVIAATAAPEAPAQQLNYHAGPTPQARAKVARAITHARVIAAEYAETNLTKTFVNTDCNDLHIGPVADDSKRRSKLRNIPTVVDRVYNICR